MEAFIDEVRIRCPVCLERQTIFVETDGGETQQLIVDCQVCCNPLDISLFWDEEKQKFKANVDRSN